MTRTIFMGLSNRQCCLTRQEGEQVDRADFQGALTAVHCRLKQLATDRIRPSLLPRSISPT
jgi:hypothetical protein